MIDIVSASRLSESDFWNTSPLGISLRRLARDHCLVARVNFANRCGLPEIYNARISGADSSEMLVFVHDDVWIDDYFVADRVVEGLRNYDVIGVAGNRRRVQFQPSWFFGPVPADCELLDGMFLAANTSTLKESGVFFDSRFDFHFYDMDICRNARQRGLRLGAWPICLTHQSGGAFGTPQWNERYRAYIEKWGN